MDLKKLLYKISEEKNMSFLEKNNLIEKSLKTILVNKISNFNKEDIKKNNYKIHNISNKELMHTNNPIFPLFFLIFFIALLQYMGVIFNMIIKLEGAPLILPYIFNGYVTISLSVIGYFTYLSYSKKVKKRLQKFNSFFSKNNITIESYMNTQYIKNSREVYFELNKELQNITETELEKEKQYLSDYLTFNFFEFQDKKENNIFKSIYQSVMENTFELEKKDINTIENKKIYNNYTIEEMKKLISIEHKKDIITRS